MSEYNSDEMDGDKMTWQKWQKWQKWQNCLILKYVDTKKCLYEVQNYKSGQDEDCPRV